MHNAHRNKRAVLAIVRELGPLSRRDIFGHCSLSAATIKRLVEELLREGIVREQTIRPPRMSRGRRSAFIELNGGYAHSMGFRISPGVMHYAVLDLAGRPLTEGTVEGSLVGPDGVIRRIVSCVRSLRREIGTQENGKFLGIGVAVAGVVDAPRGFVHFCPNLPGWENTQLMDRLKERLSVPVIVDEDVRCMTLAEKRYGTGHNHATFLYVYIGRGVGAGILLENRIYRGTNGMSGEFGHITVKENGPLCNCGNRGCLETIASWDGIIRRTEQMINSNVYTTLGRPNELLDVQSIALAAHDGDKLANMIIHETGESIGTATAALVNIFDPGLVVLGGEVIDGLSPTVYEDALRVFRTRGMHSITRRTEILSSSLAADTPARGAATLPIEKYFESEMLNIVRPSESLNGGAPRSDILDATKKTVPITD